MSEEIVSSEEMASSEERARRMGWVPREEFRGNPDNWADADTFVRMAEESLPIAKGTIKTMEKKMAQQEQMLRAQKQAIDAMRADFAEFVEFSKSAEERAYNKAIKELQKKQREAVESGDLSAFDKITSDLDAVIAEHPSITGKRKEAGSAVQGKPEDEAQAWLEAEPGVFEEWLSENSWFSEDPDMFIYATQMDTFLQAKYGFKLPRSERLKELTRMVKKKFPEKFGNTARRAGSPVEGDTGGSPSGSNGKTYNDLPPDAKKQCDKWTGKDGKGKTGTIPGLTREQYVKDYYR